MQPSFIFLVTRVGIGSALKIGAVASALAWAVFGLIGIGFQFLLINSIGSMSLTTTGSSADIEAFRAVQGVGIGVLCIVYFGGIIGAAIAGGITGAVYAWMYNLAARFVGGLEIQLQRNEYAEMDAYKMKNEF